MNNRHNNLTSAAAAVSLLTGRDGEGYRCDRLWLWLGVISLGWGVALAGLWAMTAHVFPWWYDSSNPMIPTAVVVAVMAIGPGRRALTAPAKLMEPADPAAGAVISAAVVLAVALCLQQIVPFYREGSFLPAYLAWLRPPEEYRVLVLAPVWGAWAMMAAAHFSPVAEDGDGLVADFARAQPIAGTAMWLAIALAGSLWQLNFLPYGWVLCPAGAGVLAGSFGSVVVCRRGGGLTGQTLLAANLLTQVAFLMGYLVGKTHLID